LDVYIGERHPVRFGSGSHGKDEESQACEKGPAKGGGSGHGSSPEITARFNFISIVEVGAKSQNGWDQALCGQPHRPGKPI
jgi:hypothetical protein